MQSAQDNSAEKHESPADTGEQHESFEDAAEREAQGPVECFGMPFENYDVG